MAKRSVENEALSECLLNKKCTELSPQFGSEFHIYRRNFEKIMSNNLWKPLYKNLSELI